MRDVDQAWDSDVGADLSNETSSSAQPSVGVHRDTASRVMEPDLLDVDVLEREVSVDTSAPSAHNCFN